MLILIGKTASGKTTVQNELVNNHGFSRIITYTTRPMRKGEVDGVTYNFISKDEFKEKKDNGFFIETTSYNVANGDTWYYGTAIRDIVKSNCNDVIILNPEGVKAIKEHIAGCHVCYLYLDDKTLSERLVARGDDPSESKRRIEADRDYFSGIEKYVDFTVVTDGFSVEETAATIIGKYNELHMLNDKLK